MEGLFARLGPIRHTPLPIIIISVGLVIILVSSGIWLAARLFHAPQPNASPTAQQVTSGSIPVSPLLFGSNLNLVKGQNQVLTSTAARALLQQIHMRILRLSIQQSTATTDVSQAAQLVKTLGMTPLIVLPETADTHVLQDDTALIRAMNTIFGSDTVYYEYGNEDDLLGMTANQYVNSWNNTIPHLKQLAPHGHFLGPVSFQYNQNAIMTFLQHANPLPDAVSWHEYTCDRSQSDTACLAHISAWGGHIAQARAIMTATLHRELPIMITEWNYAANALANDGKSDDSTFMRTWTKQALQTLAANHVFASMQYACTATPTALISSTNQLTAQGIIFQQEYEQIIGQGSAVQATASPVTTTMPSLNSIPTVTASGTSSPAATTTSQPIAALTTPAAPTPTPIATPTTPAAPTPTPKATATPTPNHQTIVDNLNDWNNTYSNSPGLTFDQLNSQYMGGDTSRAVRTNSSTHEYAIWKLQNMASFQAVTYFWSGEAVSPFSVYTSLDGSNWTEVAPAISGEAGNWERYQYTLSNLSNVSYIKMVWNNTTGQSWSPQIGSVTLSS